jgi:hypothetical protein
MNITVISGTNPKWANPEKTKITLDLILAGLESSPIPFTADENDIEEHGRMIFEAAKNGQYGPVGNSE